MVKQQENTITDDNLLFRIPVLDAQYTNMMRIANKLQSACLKGEKTVNHFMREIHAALEYMDHHFSTEEKLMLLLDFPDYLSHRKEHSDFLREAVKICRRIEEEQDSPSEFVDFLFEQIQRHIDAADRAFADFFLNMKVDGKLRQIAVASPLLSV